MLWIFAALAAMFTAYRFYFASYDDARYYILDGVLDDEADAVVSGEVSNYEKKENSVALYLKDVTVVLNNNESYHLSKILAYISKMPDLKAGNQVKISGSISNFESPTNPGQFNQKQYYREKNIYYKCFAKKLDVVDDSCSAWPEALCQIKKKISEAYEAALPKKESGIVNAMILGEKNLLDMDVRDLYQKTGISHLLAISGLHVSILGMAVYKTLMAPAKGIFAKSAATAITIFILAAYGQMTGFGVSTFRAVIMMAIMLLAPLANRSYDALSAAGLSATFLMLQKPFAVFSCGFLLSYGSIMGIILIQPSLRLIYEKGVDGMSGHSRRLEFMRRYRRMKKEKARQSKIFKSADLKNNELKNKLKYAAFFLTEKAADMFLTGLSVQAATLPVILYFFYEFPTYGIFVNIAVIPLASLLVTTAALGGILGLISPVLSKFVLGSTYMLLNFYEGICKIIQKLPFNVIIAGKPKMAQIAIYYLIIFIVCVLTKHFLSGENARFIREIKALATFMGIAALAAATYTDYCDGTEIVFMDVGQGDGTFIRDNTGNTYLVDGGSTSVDEVGKYRIIPFLKCRGIKKIDYMIMTHSDEDHISGLKELIAQSDGGIRIKKLLMPNPSDECKDAAYYEMIQLAKGNGVAVEYIKKGDAITNEKGFSMVCLHPEEGFKAESANAYSTSLRVRYKDTSILLTGDVEGGGEEELAKVLDRLNESYDVLKVAHHGSKNSTSDYFLQCVTPETSIISCGKYNSYGHPNKELLSRLEAIKSDIIATKDAGAVTILSDGEKIETHTWNG